MMRDPRSGQLLLEILIVVSASAVVVALGAQLVYISARGNKIASESAVGFGLAEETFEGVRAASTEKWQNIYDLTKGSTAYYPQQSSGKWVLTAGQEDVIINNTTYTRSFTVQNTCRDAASRNITGITDSSGAATTCSSSGGTHDPSTQRVSTTISWPDADTVSWNEYVSRWRNKVCVQTSWSGSGSGPVTCPSTAYDAKTNITAGDNLQLCAGGC